MIRLKNNTGGFYSLELEDVDGVRGENRVFYFTSANSEVSIPDMFVASIATNDLAFSAYKMGLFTVVKGQEILDKYLVEAGRVDASEVKKLAEAVVPDTMLLAALKTGKLEKVKEYVNSVNLSRLTQLAIDNIASISKDKIELIEKATGTSLTIDEE